MHKKVRRKCTELLKVHFCDGIRDMILSSFHMCVFSVCFEDLYDESGLLF